MNKSVLLSVKKMAVVFTVILAGFASLGSLKAQTTITGVSIGAQVGSLTYGTAGSVTFPVTFTVAGSGAGSSILSINIAAPAGVTTSFPLTVDPGAGTTATLTITITAATPASSTDFTVSTTNGAHISAPATLVVGKKPITVIGITGTNKAYDRLVTASVSGSAVLSGNIGGDDVTLTGTPSFVFANASVGTAKAITASGYTLGGAAAGNYDLVQPTYLTADITSVAVTITGLTGVNKVYDGTTTATTSGTAALSGIIAGDVADAVLAGTPVLNFATAAVGNGKAITVTGYTLTGTASGNYSLAQPAGLTANITEKGLTITGLTGVNRFYNGTTTATTTGTAALAGVVSGDVANVTLGGTPVLNFADALVGNAKAITVTGYTITGSAASNYTLAQPAGLTANIIQQPVTITGLTGVNKEYDRTTTATTSGTAALSGVIAADIANVTLGGTAILNFANALAGTAKAITVTGYTISGSASANYSLTQPTGLTANITAKALTLPDALATNKTYDGTAAAVITGTLTGIIAPDVVTLVGTGTFPSASAGAGLVVTPTCTLAGADAGNYSLTDPIGLTATISPKALTITATGPAKVYGTALEVATSTTNFTTTALAGAEAITSVTLRPDLAGLLPLTPAGSQYKVTPSAAAGSSGFVAANYTITYVDYVANVSQKPLTIVPNPGQRKVALSANPVITYTYSPALLTGDLLTGALSRAAGETVGSYEINIGTLTAGSNYTLVLAPATYYFTITSPSEALITAFNFTFLPNYTETINQSTGAITLQVAYSADVTSLIARFTVSPGAVVRVLSVVQTNGVTANNFTGVVNYVVTSADGLASKSYNVTVTKNAVVADKELLTFSFPSVPGATGVINPTLFTITVPVPNSTNVASLVATFTTSPLAQVKIGGILQTSGSTPNDYSLSFVNGVVYQVIAENGSSRNYTVFLTRNIAGSEKKLLAFSLPGVDGAVDELAHTVELIIPYAYNVTSRAASFTTSYGATVWIGSAQQFSGVTTNDFSQALLTSMTYTVKAENASTQDYTVHITRTAASSAKALLTFRFNNLAVPAVGVLTGNTFNVTVPFSANLTDLMATFTNSQFSKVYVGANQQFSGETHNNFSSDVTYRVEAEDGTSATYIIHVTKTPANTQAQLLTFTIAAFGANVNGVINEGAKTVLVEIPYGSNLSDLVATFTLSDFAVAKIGSTVQTSGFTHNDFSGVKPYTIFAEAGNTELYLITVRVYPAILTFSFNDALGAPAGTINHFAHTIDVHVPFTVNRTTLKAYFTVSGGANVTIGATAQVSGTTVNDFSSQVVYTLQVPGGSTSSYTVTLTTDPVRTGKQLLTFAFNGLTPAITGVISETLKTVTVNVPFATNVTNLIATFTVSELATVKVGTTLQVSAVTANNFTTATIYHITAEDGLSQDYTVTVIVAVGSAAKDITYFAFEDLNPDVVCVINETNRTITATVPYGTNRSNLRAFYTASPLSSVRVLGAAGGLQQSGLTINDFRVPVLFEVTAQDGTTKIYTVSIAEGPDNVIPIVSNAAQTVTNLPGQFVILRSNEGTGKVYLILSTATQVTVADLNTAVTAGLGKSAYVSAANTDIPVSTANLAEGTYYTYAIDAAGNKSLRGTNAIIVQDRIPPVVSVDAQTKSNSMTNFVNIRSSDQSSLVYLILEGVPQASKIQLDAAVSGKRGAVGIVSAANVDVPVSVAGLVPGNYHAYAMDVPAQNLSLRSTNTVVITEASRLKLILAYSFNGMETPAIGQIVGTDISVKVKVGTPINALVATFTISDKASAYVGSTLQVSNVTRNDFTNPVIYRVFAEDGSYFDYTVTVTFNTGIEETEWLNSIKAYPNPVADRLTIEMTRPADRIQVINALGQGMEDIQNAGQSTVVIPTASWMKGIYFVRYYLDNKFIGVQKLIKE
ncbi:MAG: YDG domain-containing protein [Bacteroidales bacterium]|jgi:hypothetical protein